MDSENNNMSKLEQGIPAGSYVPREDSSSKLKDDEGRQTAGKFIPISAHIITTVIGSGGVMSLAWAIAQLGWVVGPIIMLLFSLITYLSSTLLADCCRALDPVSTGKRNYANYMGAVEAYLGHRKTQLCGFFQYAYLAGITIGYTIRASISMAAVKGSNCFHKNGPAAKCYTSNNTFMVLFGIIQVVLSQISNYCHGASWFSLVGAAMSIAYSSIGISLSVIKVAGAEHLPRTSLTGVEVGIDVTATEKVWRTFQAIGDIALSYAYMTDLIEIQHTVNSGPQRNKKMRRVSLAVVSMTTMVYILCGCLGYAAFGHNTPRDFLAPFGFYNPYWLINFANVCATIHLVGAYQVFCQPIFDFIETKCKNRWPQNSFITQDHNITIPVIGANYPLNLFKLVWRTAYVILTTILAMLFPFFNEVFGLIGAASFWLLNVYFPIEIHIAQSNLTKYTRKWVAMKLLSYGCLVVSLVAAVGSTRGLVNALKTYKPFQTYGQLNN